MTPVPRGIESSLQAVEDQAQAELEVRTLVARLHHVPGDDLGGIRELICRDGGEERFGHLQRLKTAAPALMQVATAVGLMWAFVLVAGGMVFNAGIAAAVALYPSDPGRAVSVWQAIEPVSQGLGGSVLVIAPRWWRSPDELSLGVSPR